jgi:hypothetical protein
MPSVGSNCLAHRATLVPTGRKSSVRSLTVSPSRPSPVAENRANDATTRSSLLRRSALVLGLLLASRSTARNPWSYAFSRSCCSFRVYRGPSCAGRAAPSFHTSMVCATCASIHDQLYSCCILLMVTKSRVKWFHHERMATIMRPPRGTAYALHEGRLQPAAPNPQP